MMHQRLTTNNPRLTPQPKHLKQATNRQTTKPLPRTSALIANHGMKGSNQHCRIKPESNVGLNRKENILNLLPKVEKPKETSGDKLYKSKFHEKVKEEASKGRLYQKRTMGSPNVKGECQERLKRKTAVSDVSENRKISEMMKKQTLQARKQTKSEAEIKKNNISENRKASTSQSSIERDSKSKVTKIAPPSASPKCDRSIDRSKVASNVKSNRNCNFIVDHVSGRRQDAVKAGLKPHYSVQQKFGKVPAYLKKRKQELEEKKQRDAQLAAQADVKGVNGAAEKFEQLDEDERQMLIKGLKAQWDIAMKQYQSLSVIVDTISKKRRKIELENRLDQLESDHLLLTKSPIVLIV